MMSPLSNRLSVLAVAVCGPGPDFFVDRALASILGGEYDRAMHDLETALNLEPRHPGALVNMGVVYHRTGRHPEAADLYKRAIAADDGDDCPSTVTSSLAVGWSYGTIAAHNLALLKT